MKKCVKCPFLEFDVAFYCGVCECTLSMKGRVIDEVCPHPDGNKW